MAAWLYHRTMVESIQLIDVGLFMTNLLEKSPEISRFFVTTVLLLISIARDNHDRRTVGTDKEEGGVLIDDRLCGL